MTILCDTNIVLRTRTASDPRHGDIVRIQHRYLADGATLSVAPQTLYELGVVLTRPLSANGYGMDGGRAAEELRRVEAAYEVLAEPVGLYRIWLSLCEERNVLGKQAHDARLAAFAIGLGLDAILTLNASDFSRYGVPLLIP